MCSVGTKASSKSMKVDYTGKDLLMSLSPVKQLHFFFLFYMSDS